MPVIPVDTSEAMDMGAIAPGTYHARITEATAQQTKGEGGKPKLWMVVPKFAVTVDGKERTRKAYVVTQGEGTYGFDQLLRACNMDALADQYKDPSVDPKPPFDTDVLIGQELNVVIDSEYYQKKDPAGNPVGEPELRDRIKTYLKA